MGATATKPSAGFLSLVLVSVLAPGGAAVAQMSGDTTLNQPFSVFGSDATAARAPAYTFGVDAGIGETDNVTLVSTNRVSQTMATADVDFSVNRHSRLFDLNAVGDFTDLEYLQHAFGNELLGRFDGIADVAIVPGRLIWVVRDDFGQSAVDPYTPVTPNNIENINYLTTGPDLKWRFGAVNFVDVSARYARAQYQTSPFNSNRVLASVGVGRDISAAAAVSLNANTEHVMFDNTAVNADFNRSSGFGRYEVHGARTDFVGELGVTVINQSGVNALTTTPVPVIRLGPGTPAPGFAGLALLAEPAGTLTGPLAKFELSRKISASAKVIFTAGQDLTDQSSSFSGQTTGVSGLNTITPGVLTSDSYRMTYASAGWQYLRNRTTLSVTARWERDIYPGLSSLDLTRPSVDFNLERRLTSTLKVQLLGRWDKFNYPYSTLTAQTFGSTNYADSVLGAALVWRHGRGLEIRLRCDHDTYTVSNGNTGYHETRAFLTVGYRPAPAPATEELQ